MRSGFAIFTASALICSFVCLSGSEKVPVLMSEIDEKLPNPLEIKETSNKISEIAQQTSSNKQPALGSQSLPKSNPTIESTETKSPTETESKPESVEQSQLQPVSETKSPAENKSESVEQSQLQPVSEQKVDSEAQTKSENAEKIESQENSESKDNSKTQNEDPDPFPTENFFGIQNNIEDVFTDSDQNQDGEDNSSKSKNKQNKQNQKNQKGNPSKKPLRAKKRNSYFGQISPKKAKKTKIYTDFMSKSIRRLDRCMRNTKNYVRPTYEKLNPAFEMETEPEGSQVSQSFAKILEEEKTHHRADTQQIASEGVEVPNQNQKETKCDAKKLGAFGISTSVTEGFVSSSQEVAYCRRNKLSCCRTQNFREVLPRFAASAHELRKRIESLEELLTLFRGPNVKYFLTAVEQLPRCKALAEKISPGTGKKNFFSTEFQKEKLDDIDSLLLDLEPYLSQSVSYNANLVCAVCNPLNQKHFAFSSDPKKPSLFVANESVCRANLDNLDFEIRAALIFDDYISKIAELIKCEANIENNPDYNVTPLMMKTVLKQKTDLEACIENGNFLNENCVKLCSREIGQYSFVIPFFVSVKQALKVLFFRLSTMSIQTYYSKTKNQDFVFGFEDQPIKFFKSLEGDSNAYNYESLSMSFEKSSGIKLFSSFMSKTFTQAKFEAILKLVGFAALFFSFLG